MNLSTVTPFFRLFHDHPRYFSHVAWKKMVSFHRIESVARAGYPEKSASPQAYEFVLTYKCNLRCKMCFEWGSEGWCRGESAEEMNRGLDYAVVEKIIEDNKNQDVYFILFGGEPFLYSRFADLLMKLRGHRKFCYVCTNGLLLSKFREEIAGNPYLALTVSLDGLEPENDKIRGAGAFRKVISGLQEIKESGRSPYVGIELTVLPENTPTLGYFCEEMVRAGADWVVLNLCWFIGPRQAAEYEEFVKINFGLEPKSHRGYLNPYTIDRRGLAEQFENIRARKWPIQISWMPPLDSADQINTYLDKPENPLGRTMCNKQWLRMDIQPNGDVVACKLYPDIVVGNVKEESLDQIWNSERYRKFRALLKKKLLPVCSKCNALYLYDSRRTHL